ncbi:MAG: ShlB/FhaC/HecB family hemolysin secretion/activation protein [Aquabacterium sp.]|nr:MAG: ShlB/FhaC/HecB family hemolysin secretion/activation protein [Aquabacterium sp.]
MKKHLPAVKGLHLTPAVVTTALLSVFGTAHTQTRPDAGSVLQQIPQPSTPAPAEAVPLPRLDNVPTQPPMRSLPSGPQVEVTRFEITGNRVIDTATLQAQIAGEGGRSMSLEEIEAVATRLTRYYRARGYFVARVYVPQQEIKDGAVALRAVEGNYGRFILKNESLVRDSTVQAMLDDVKHHDIVSLDTMERAMLIINDTPGSRVVRADVRPGEVVGTSDFVVETAADPRYDGYLMADNHGSRYTGKARASFNWNWNSPTRRGDRLSVSGLASGNSDLLNGRIGYSLPLAPSGWRGEAAVSQTTYELGDVFRSLDAQGRARSIELGVTYPIRRIQAQTLEAGLSYAHRRLRDDVRSTETVTKKTSQALTASLNLRDERTLFGYDGVTQAGLGLTTGYLGIRSADARLLDEADGGPNTNGRFSRLNLMLSRYLLLPRSFSLTATLKHQSALFNKNLDGSERMPLGGISGVLAYPSGELSGSSGTLLRLELARPLPAWRGLQHQWSVFSDLASARTLKTDPYRTLRDVGVGWAASHSSGLVAKVWWAHRIEDLPAQSEHAGRNRFLVQAGWVF